MGEYHSPGTSPFGTGRSFDGPDGLAGFAVEDVEPGLLGGLREGFDGAAVDGDVGKDGAQGMSKSQMPWWTS